MSRKSKIFLSLASLCFLSLMVLCFGVYSAVSVDYTISGSISYEVDSAFVNITTKVYAYNELLAGSEGKDITNEMFQQYVMPSLASEKIVGDKTFVDLSFDEISSSSLNFVDTNQNYQYNTLTNEGDETASGIKIDYDKYFTYFIVVKVQNLADNYVSAEIQTDIVDEGVNSLWGYTGKIQNIQKNTNNGQGKNIIICYTLKDPTFSVEEANFSHLVKIESSTEYQGNSGTVNYSYGQDVNATVTASLYDLSPLMGDSFDEFKENVLSQMDLVVSTYMPIFTSQPPEQLFQSLGASDLSPVYQSEYNPTTGSTSPVADKIVVDFTSGYFYVLFLTIDNLSTDSVLTANLVPQSTTSSLAYEIYTSSESDTIVSDTPCNAIMLFVLKDDTLGVESIDFDYSMQVNKIDAEPYQQENINVIDNTLLFGETYMDVTGNVSFTLSRDNYTIPMGFDVVGPTGEEDNHKVLVGTKLFTQDNSDNDILNSSTDGFIVSQLMLALLPYSSDMSLLPKIIVLDTMQLEITSPDFGMGGDVNSESILLLLALLGGLSDPTTYSSTILGLLRYYQSYGVEFPHGYLEQYGLTEVPEPYSQEERDFIAKYSTMSSKQREDLENYWGNIVKEEQGNNFKIENLLPENAAFSKEHPLKIINYTLVPGTTYKFSDYLTDESYNNEINLSGAMEVNTLTIPAEFTYDIGSIDLQYSKINSYQVENGNTKYTTQDGVLFTSDMSTLLAYPNGVIKDSYVIPDVVNSIYEGSFKFSNNLSRIIVNYNNIKNLNSFRSTPSTLVLRSDKYISRFAIANLYSDYITNIEIEYVDVSSGLVYEERGNGYYVTAYTPQDGKTMVSIPNTHKPDNGEELSVIGIAANAFSGATNLENIGLPDTIQVVENNAFDGAVNVKFVDFGNAEITSYGASVFGDRKDIIIYTQNETTKNTIKQATPNSTSTNISLTIETGRAETSASTASQRGSFDMVFIIDGHEFKVDTAYDMQLSTLYNGYMIISSENSGDINVSVSANINAETYGTSQASNVDHIQEQIAIAKVENGETILIDGTPVDENYYNHPGGTATATYSGTATVGDELELVVNFTVMTYVQCFTEGTLVTLADGSTKPIEDVTYDDLLLVWDFDRGEFSYSYPVWIAEGGTYNNYYLMKFDDGSEVEIVLSHRLFDVDGLSFEKSIDAIYSQVGDRFFRQTIDENGNPKITTPTCISIEKINESCKYYNMVTSQSLNFFANGFLGATGVANMYTFEKTDDGRYIHNQEQLQDTKYNGDVFAYDMFDSSIVPYEIYIAYRLGETKNMADILAKAPPYNQYPIEQVYQIAVKLIEDYFPESYFEDIVALPDTYKITTSEGVSTRVDKGETYTLESPKDLADFEGYYNTFDGKMYMPGDEVTIYMNTHFIARYSA